MKKYFLHNGTEQQGPFDLDDLKAKKINKDTSIWYDGLPEWTTAEKIDELKEILKSSTPPPFGTKQSAPPPINKQTTQQTQTATAQPKKKSKIGRTILIVVIAIVIVIAVVVGGLVVIDNMNNDDSEKNSYQEQVMTIEEIERSQPTNFLSASGTYEENFWGNKFTVNCEITNKATVATYKDAVIRITYYSKTKTELWSKDYTVYETFPPTSTKTVELKIDNYKDVSYLDWDVISATSN